VALAEKSHLPQKINPGGESAHGQPENRFWRPLRFRIYPPLLPHLGVLEAPRHSLKGKTETDWIAIAGSHAHVLHSPAFWLLAIIAFGVGFSCSAMFSADSCCTRFSVKRLKQVRSLQGHSRGGERFG